MNQAILLHMIAVVEEYIYRKKSVRVSIDFFRVATNLDQVNKLIDAYNHVQNENAKV